MSRGAMTMRAQVSRDTSRPADPWGREEPPGFSVVGTVPCRAWSKMRREVRDDGKDAVLEDLRAVVPHDADVLEEDRLVIENRLGATLFGGPLAVLTVSRRGASGSSPGHLELLLARHV